MTASFTVVVPERGSTWLYQEEKSSFLHAVLVDGQEKGGGTKHETSDKEYRSFIQIQDLNLNFGGGDR